MPPASSRDDFLTTGANRDALAMLDAPEGWPQGRLMLIGGPGSGKSHLAGFWADEHGAQIVQGWTLAPGNVDELIAPGGAVVVNTSAPSPMLAVISTSDAPANCLAWA